MRKSAKYLGRQLLFVCILAVLIGLVSIAAKPRGFNREDGFYEPRAYAYMAEPENSIDVLFLGDSLCGFSCSPVQIWRETGITSFVCSTKYQHLFQTKDMLHDFLKVQKPRLVALEVNALCAPCTVETELPYQLEKWVPALRYHDRWKTADQAQLGGPRPETKAELGRGFEIAYTVLPAGDVSDYMRFTQDKKDLGSQNKKYVRQIVRTCRDRDIEVLFFSVPSPKNWSYRRHNAVAELAQELDVAYLDLNLMEEQVPINWKMDTSDWGEHMNHYGAEKVSGFMARYLADSGLFADKRQDPAYAQWNEDVSRYDQRCVTLEQEAMANREEELEEA